MSKIILTIIVVIIVIYGLSKLGSNQQPTIESGEVGTPIITNEQATSTPSTETTVKEFTIKASNFKFSLEEIKVKKGDRVKIILVNENGFHDWVIDEFNAATKQIQATATDTVEFIADKTGSFEYYCSVGQHRQMGMKGNLIVEE